MTLICPPPSLVPQNPWSWILVGVGIGVLSSTLGIGGGELMGPLMLALQVLPQVCTHHMQHIG